MEKITYTNQRVEILNFLKDNYSHPAVEEVYEAVKKKLTRISKATIAIGAAAKTMAGSESRRSTIRFPRRA